MTEYSFSLTRIRAHFTQCILNLRVIFCQKPLKFPKKNISYRLSSNDWYIRLVNAAIFQLEPWLILSIKSFSIKKENIALYNNLSRISPKSEGERLVYNSVSTAYFCLFIFFYSALEQCWLFYKHQEIPIILTCHHMSLLVKLTLNEYLSVRRWDSIGISLPLMINDQWLGKKELKKSAFWLKSATDLSWWNIRYKALFYHLKNFS